MPIDEGPFSAAKIYFELPASVRARFPHPQSRKTINSRYDSFLSIEKLINAKLSNKGIQASFFIGFL